MALKATIFKAQLNIADMERGYYQEHTLTLARHPSETDERMMVRILAFSLNASPTLIFSKGLSNDGEAELWDKNLQGDVELWIEFGQSEEKWLRKACGRARHVKLYTYGGRAVPIWWQQNQDQLARYQNLQIWELPETQVRQTAQLVNRTMNLQCTINDGQIWISDNHQSVLVEPVMLKDFAPAAH